jgi:hypothetical protein
VDKINHILEKSENHSKEKIIPIVEIIRILLTELMLHEERLEKECPSDWSYAKKKMDDLVGQIESSVDRFWDEIPKGFIRA